MHLLLPSCFLFILGFWKFYFDTFRSFMFLYILLWVCWSTLFFKLCGFHHTWKICLSFLQIYFLHHMFFLFFCISYYRYSNCATCPWFLSFAIIVVVVVKLNDFVFIALAGVAQWLSTSLWSKGSPVWFPLRSHAWVVDQAPSRACVRGNHTLMFFSLSFSLPSRVSKINR